MGPETSAEVPLTPERVVQLIEEERIPLTSKSSRSVGDPDSIVLIDEITVFVPPVGTRFGDTVEGDGSSTPITYTSPEGEVRGTATIQVLPLEEGLAVRRAIEKALRVKGIDTSSRLAYAWGRVQRWFIENVLY
ncbi:MAG: hypothetical protein WC285_04535 [Candidatus Gracilibacteria bacterium]|jgi:hypothetical protein